MDRISLQRLQKNWPFLMLVLICEWLNGSALAESGSAQTTMAIVVPPNGVNLVTAPVSQNEPSSYVADTNVSVMEQGDNVTYQVWISI